MRSNFRKSLLSLAIGASLAVAVPAMADNTNGTLRGTVVGVSDDVTVKVTDLQRGVSKTYSLNDGQFRAGSLTPGEYKLEVIQNGQIIDTQTAVVSLGGTTSIYLGDASNVEEVIVQGERVAAIDTGIAESGLVISTEELAVLPVQRDLTSVALLAPGVSKGVNAFGNNASFGGASVAENTSFINGLNTTNFRNGLGFSKVPFEFYDTIQVKTGGYSAKYGRSLGGVMNARSKSGTNEFVAGANFYYDADIATQPNTYTADNDEDVYNETNFNLYGGGAIIQDRLFYYGIYNRNVTNQEYYGLLSGRGYKANEETDFWGIKLDGYITDNHRVELTAFSDERDTIEQAYEYDGSTGVVGNYIGDTILEKGGMNWIATYTGDITDTFQVSLSYGENQARRTEAPATADIPVVYEYNGGFTQRGNWTNFTVDKGEDTRKMARLDLAWDLGDHLLEFGLDREVNTSVSETINSGGVYWLLDPTNAYNGCTAIECPQGANARKRTYEVGGEFEVESLAYYIQDTWQITDNLQVELGLRNESFKNLNGNGESFIEIDNQWAPRLSASWDPTGQGNQKVFGSWGLYYLPIASNTNIRMAGNETYIQEYYDWDGSCTNGDFTPCNLGSVYRTDVFGDGSVPDTRSLVDTNIEPMYQSEFILGYQFIMDEGYELGVKGVYRVLESSIEDVAIDAAVIDHYNSTGTWDASQVGGDTVEDVFSGFHQYVLTNPGQDMNIYIPEQDEFISLTEAQLGYPKAARTYKAMEFSFARPFDGKWATDVSYTLAYSRGNNEGYVRSDNGQDDAGLTTNFDQPGLTDHATGYLPNDHRHTIKVRGVYEFDMGLRLGANLMWQTGRPKNCFGVHPTDGFAAQYGAESFYCDGEPAPRGSKGRTPSVWDLNLNAQYDLEFSNAHTVQLSMDLFNVFNNQAITEYVETGDTDGGQPDQYYNEPTRYQSPRAIRFSARYEFN